MWPLRQCRRHGHVPLVQLGPVHTCLAMALMLRTAAGCGIPDEVILNTRVLLALLARVLLRPTQGLPVAKSTRSALGTSGGVACSRGRLKRGALRRFGLLLQGLVLLPRRARGCCYSRRRRLSALSTTLWAAPAYASHRLRRVASNKSRMCRVLCVSSFEVGMQSTAPSNSNQSVPMPF